VRQFRTKTAGVASYDVEMDSVASSARARSLFGGFFKGKTAGRKTVQLPADLTKISINIHHTFNTRIRVRLMKQMAISHQAANTDYKCFVTNYNPRPCLKVKYPNSTKVDSFQFVEAVRRFSHLLSAEFLKAETAYAKTIGLDKLVPTFIVLNPDLIQPSVTFTPAPPPAIKRTADQMTGGPSKAGPIKKHMSKGNKGKGKGKSGGPSTRSNKPGPPTATTQVSNRFATLASPAPDLSKSFESEPAKGHESEGTMPAKENETNNDSESSDSMSE